jgi:hypothetical protein
MRADKNCSRRSNSAYAPNSQPRILTRVCQGHVVTTDLPTLGINPKQSRCGSTTQEAKDLVVLQIARRTVRKAGADGPQALGGQSATLWRTIRKRQQNLQYRTLNNRRSAPCPRTVREQLVPRGQSAVSRRTARPTHGRFDPSIRTVRQTPRNETLTPRKVYARTRKNWTNTRRTHTTRTVRGLQPDSLPALEQNNTR